MTETCQVLIVGGGPAGSSCAAKLCQAGLDVIVLDRAVFPREKVCAGWITPPVVQLLQIDLSEYASSRIAQPITGFRTGIFGRETLETHFPDPVSYGIRRCEFDDFLLKRCGARLRLGEPLERLERRDGGWLSNGTIRSQLVVGAGGHFCPVARQLGARKRDNSVTVMAQEAEFCIDEDDHSLICAETPELYFAPDLGGYAWCFRKGNYLNVGIGRTAAHDVLQQRESFCRWLEKHRGLGPIKQPFHGHAYELYLHSMPRLLDEGLLLIGDAAGLASPQSGEGIRPAIESGLMAADVILAAEGNYSSVRLDPYRERVIARFGNPPRAARSGWLPGPWLEGIAAALLSSRWFTRRILLERWFLHRDQLPLEQV